MFSKVVWPQLQLYINLLTSRIQKRSTCSISDTTSHPARLISIGPQTMAHSVRLWLKSQRYWVRMLLSLYLIIVVRQND